MCHLTSTHLEHTCVFLLLCHCMSDPPKYQTHVAKQVSVRVSVCPAELIVVGSQLLVEFQDEGTQATQREAGT